MTSAYWYNGQMYYQDTIALPIADPGLLYGATVFTTLRVYDSSLQHPLTAWQAHRDRLQQDIYTLGWSNPNWQRLQQGATELSQIYAVLRLTLFPDGREWITGRSLPVDLPRWQTEGITAWVAEAIDSVSRCERSLPLHKTGNYLAPWLARQRAQTQGAQEAILVNAAGEWLETATGNLWGWAEGQWWTPPLAAGILPGVMRSHIISRLRCQNKEINQHPWSPDVVAQLEAIAYSNSVVQFVPIHYVLHQGQMRRYPPDHVVFQSLRSILKIL